MKQEVKIFVSYAHRSGELAKQFIEKFFDYIKPSKSFDYKLWIDAELKVGEKWDEKIISKLNECDCGLLLISTSFLNSEYIIEKELPKLLEKNKLLIPVLLSEVDFERHDLRGLEKYQIYRFNDSAFKSPRSYSKLKKNRRDDFIADLFKQMDDRLKEHFKL